MTENPERERHPEGKDRAPLQWTPLQCNDALQSQRGLRERNYRAEQQEQHTRISEMESSKSSKDTPGPPRRRIGAPIRRE